MFINGDTQRWSHGKQPSHSSYSCAISATTQNERTPTYVTHEGVSARLDPTSQVCLTQQTPRFVIYGKCFKSADAERFNLYTVLETDPSAMFGLRNFVGWDKLHRETPVTVAVERNGEGKLVSEMSEQRLVRTLLHWSGFGPWMFGAEPLHFSCNLTVTGIVLRDFLLLWMQP